MLEDRGRQVATTIPDDDLAVFGDPDRLAQVLSNLITNAAKYSDRGSQIRIGVQRAGATVKLSVSDDGVGIAPDMLASIFDPFVQQPQTLDRSQGGLGLGLAIAKNLVRAHDGRLYVRSEGVGRGSTFVVELPTSHVLREAARSAVPGPGGARTTSTTATTIRILVVDDNRDAANILRLALEGRGHVVATTYDGPSALELAKTFMPQVALVDIGLPVMDGYRLAELLRASHDLPIVAITGYGQASDRQRTAAGGFAAHLVKPVDFDELNALVQGLATAT